jgi:PAS domain S-box-containing protein
LLSESPSASYIKQRLENEIDERRRTEEKLRYQATLLENVSDAVISVDMDFKIRSWNDTAENIYGWKAEEVIGKQFREVTALEYLDEETRS